MNLLHQIQQASEIEKELQISDGVIQTLFNSSNFAAHDSKKPIISKPMKDKQHKTSLELLKKRVENRKQLLEVLDEINCFVRREIFNVVERQACEIEMLNYLKETRYPSYQNIDQKVAKLQ